MAGVNKVIIVGYLGKDPRIAKTQAGARIASFSVATSESWRDKATGERREETEWHQVVIYNERLVDAAEKFLKKGSKVYVEGKNATRAWTDRAGVTRYVTEVVLKPFRGELTLLDTTERAPAPDEGSYGAAPAGPDDEIPFG
ncbi:MULTISPECIES: single-stranded DNA-binding protein [Xanthobacter]|uniref:single-stranded DNA-binding protein n=1 Tax=Xanthobacter TaxID=279 RepID=UPI0035B03DCE